MKIERQKLAAVVREKRESHGYTQTDLSERTGISLRSIQRIEKAEVLPRPFTIKALASVLDFSVLEIKSEDPEGKDSGSVKKVKKIIVSAVSPLIIFLLAFAFLVQSPEFPESTFEAALFWAAVVFIIGLVQWVIWVSKGQQDRI
ncbi:helix-turn-helix domain-containing protein [Salinimicrobium sp. HB62]|uniref:helix-turn-helix domain-containing protein n=1 Tax=Salinimicrobium sp. HB62 TaxID=3077781 RepID=UPI002D7788DC|nr:helix-turn-helix domain-containing protein [Salinimicrobium sp. HB62]